MFNVNDTLNHRDKVLPSHHHTPDGSHWACQGTVPREMGKSVLYRTLEGQRLATRWTRPPRFLLPLQRTVCHRPPWDNTQNVQTSQRDWLDVSSDSRTLGNENSAKSGSVTDDLGDRLQLKTSSIEPLDVTLNFRSEKLLLRIRGSLIFSRNNLIVSFFSGFVLVKFRTFPCTFTVELLSPNQ